MPLFSIIVPVYNVEEYLQECVLSVLNQSFDDFELILVDDGSTDCSFELCKKFEADNNCVKAFRQSNSGASGARNNGLECATGEYILFLDSDDFYNDKDALLKLKDKIDSTGADAVIFGCTDWNMKTNETVVSRTGYNLELINENDINKTLHYLLSSKMLPGGPTIFTVKRSVIEENGIRFKTGIQDEDYDFVLSVFCACKSVCAIDNPFYTYRKGRDNSVTGSSNIKMIEGIAYTLDKWLPISESIENATIKKDVQNYLAFIYTTGFVVSGRMDSKTRKKALAIMKKYKSVLHYGYWRKTKITRIAVNLLGANLFSRLSSVYFKLTHI